MTPKLKKEKMAAIKIIVMTAGKQMALTLKLCWIIDRNF
jgi:hypothetical protein